MDAGTILTLIAPGGQGERNCGQLPLPLPILIPLDPPLALAFYYPEWEGTRAGEGSFDRCWRIDPLHPRHSINKHGQPPSSVCSSLSAAFHQSMREY